MHTPFVRVWISWALPDTLPDTTWYCKAAVQLNCMTALTASTTQIRCLLPFTASKIRVCWCVHMDRTHWVPMAFYFPLLVIFHYSFSALLFFISESYIVELPPMQGFHPFLLGSPARWALLLCISCNKYTQDPLLVLALSASHSCPYKT